MYRLEHHVGRLVELTASTITTSQDFVEMTERLRAIYQRVGQPLVVVTDSRDSVSVPPSLAVTAGRGMRGNNDFIERSGILVAERLRSEIGRIVKDAAHADRRVFAAAAELKRWLRDVLTPAEQARLDAFLG